MSMVILQTYLVHSGHGDHDQTDTLQEAVIDALVAEDLDLLQRAPSMSLVSMAFSKISMAPLIESSTGI